LIDLKAERENAFDSMRFSRESFSNEIDESDLHPEKHDEQRISIFSGIVIDVIGSRSKEDVPMRVTRRLADREGKKADDGTMTSSPDANPTTVAHRPATQTLTPATTTRASDIEKTRECGVSEILRAYLFGALSADAAHLRSAICIGGCVLRLFVVCMFCFVMLFYVFGRSVGETQF
jgi:hypothetical protein